MKTYKHSIIGILIIFTIVFSTCSKKSPSTEGSAQSQQTQTAQTHHADEHEGGPGDDYEALPPGFGYPYTAILDGDLSEFAGTWVNGNGDRYPLRADGVFDGGLNAYEFTRGADKDSPYIANGTNYEWLVNMGGEAGVFEIWLFPAGVDIKNRSGEIIQTDKTKDRIFFEYITASDKVYYREGELPASQNKSAQTALEHEELRIGSSVSGTVGGDWIEKYNIRSLETGFILLKIESDVEIYMEVYNGEQFIFSNMGDNDVIFKNAEITAKPNTVYLITVQSYVRDVKEAAFRITASFDR